MSGCSQAIMISDVTVTLSRSGWLRVDSSNMRLELVDEVGGVRQGGGGRGVEKFTRKTESSVVHHLCSGRGDIPLESGSDA